VEEDRRARKQRSRQPRLRLRFATIRPERRINIESFSMRRR